jgi:hypothetical protein
MRAPAPLVALVLCISACRDSLAPEPLLLLGAWGSPAAELVALRAGAELQLECSSVVVAEPIQLRSDQTFQARGEYWGSQLLLGDRPEVVLTGTRAGSTVVLHIDRGPTAGASYTLVAGVQREYTDVPSCPQ